MTTAFLVIHIIITCALVGAILIQRSEGGGLGMGSGNMGGLMTTRGTANLLTRTTAVLAGLFFTTTILLALLFKGGHAPKSILETTTPTQQQAPAMPVAPTVPAVPQKTAEPAKPETTPQKSEVLPKTETNKATKAPAKEATTDKPKK